MTGAGGQRRLAFGLVLPVLVLLVGLNIFPLLYNVALGFTNAELSGGAVDWVGGRNYATVFGEGPYARAVRTTALFVLAAVGAELVLGFLMALALRRPFAGRPALLTLLLVPMMLSPAVMGLYWNLVLNGRYGIVNQLLRMGGLPEPQWLTDPSLKLFSIIAVDVWMWTPFMMLIALAGLNAIPRAVEEAAQIDRAGPWRRFRHIVLPHVTPFLFLGVLFRATDALKQFDLVMAVTGPNDAATQTLSARLYQVVFGGYKVGLGAAYGCVVLVAVIALASVFIRYLDWLRGRQGAGAS